MQCAYVTECEIVSFNSLAASYVSSLYKDAEIVIELGPEIEKIAGNISK